MLFFNFLLGHSQMRIVELNKLMALKKKVHKYL